MPIIDDYSVLKIDLFFFPGCLATELQAPRFITQPHLSGSIVAEGRTKILQCQALGKYTCLTCQHDCVNTDDGHAL